MNPQPFSLTLILGTHVGAYMGILISMLFWGSLTYWNYRQAKRKSTWSWSGVFLRVFLLMGAVAVFVCGFMLPLGKWKAMDTHPNFNFAITMAGLIVFVGLLYYFFAKYPLKPHEQVAAPSSTGSRSDINRGLIIIFAMICVSGSLAQTPAHAESLYKDPAGIFTVMLPANWQTQQEPGSQMVSFFDEKSQAFVYVGVVSKNEASTPTADAELETVQSHLGGNCPQAKIQKRGLTTIGDIPGAFFLVHCADSKGGLETMKFAVASKPGLPLVVTSGSPAPTYETALPDINSIEHSLKLLIATAQVQPTERAQSAETSQAGEHSSTLSSSDGSGMYRDPWGRYSLTVPDGWSAEPQAKSGVLQLSFGPNWAMLITGSGGEPREVNHQITQQIQAQFIGFQLLNEGELQVNGHPSHGTNATGMNPKGERVSILVLSIGAGSGHFLTVISSSSNDQAKTVNATIMQMAQSIRFGGN
jgi:hypothetical protein